MSVAKRKRKIRARNRRVKEWANRVKYLSDLGEKMGLMAISAKTALESMKEMTPTQRKIVMGKTPH
jgi:hypothetical protein